MVINPVLGHGLKGKLSFMTKKRIIDLLSEPLNAVVLILIFYSLFIKSSVILFIIRGVPFAPFLSIFGSSPSVPFSLAMTFVPFVVLLLIVFKKIKDAAFVTACWMFLVVLSSKLLFSNSYLLVACILFIISIAPKREMAYRIQFSLLYSGAGISKLMDVDWRNGAYMSNFIENTLLQELLITSQFDWFATCLGIGVIIIELGVAVSILFSKFTRLALNTILLFHLLMLLVTRGQLSMHFMYIMSASVFLFSSYRAYLTRRLQRFIPIGTHKYLLFYGYFALLTLVWSLMVLLS